MSAPRNEAVTVTKHEPAPATPRTSRAATWIRRAVYVALLLSLGYNFWQQWRIQDYFRHVAPPRERFHSGDAFADDRIAVIRVRGTIMPPFTARILRAVQRAQEDDRVKGVLLAIDSPGGLVADSHQIYHKLQELREQKPVYVSMSRMAASGGYYIAMGAGVQGRLFAEPTTWTGSIGVIIPRYDASQLAEKMGVSTDSLKTGRFKDTLNPFRPLTDDEKQLWDTILDESFVRFKTVISENRSQLNAQQVADLATGQIYTANQALELGMIDEIGFEEEAIEALQKHLQLDAVRVVSYDFTPGIWDIVFDYIQAKEEGQEWQRWLDLTVPKAMYYCSWSPAIPTSFR